MSDDKFVAYTKIDLYAFWPYDTFPYVLGAKAERMNDEGKVYVPNYQGWIKPIILLPIKQGEAFKAKLDLMERERGVAKLAFDEEWDKQLEKLVPFTDKIPHFKRKNK